MELHDPVRFPRYALVNRECSVRSRTSKYEVWMMFVDFMWQACNECVRPRLQRTREPTAHQAATLTELLHGDTRFEAGATVLEVGCGVGAQRVILVENSPDALITSIDISPDSIDAARAKLSALGRTNVEFRVADIFDLSFQDESFDHVLICFVLEHLADPVSALRALRRVVKRGGSITLIEGDHGSTFFHPNSVLAQRAVRCQVELQARAGGNANIGRSLYPLLDAAGFGDVKVSPRLVCVDGSRPHLIEDSPATPSPP